MLFGAEDIQPIQLQIFQENFFSILDEEKNYFYKDVENGEFFFFFILPASCQVKTSEQISRLSTLEDDHTSTKKST